MPSNLVDRWAEENNNVAKKWKVSLALSANSTGVDVKLFLTPYISALQWS